MPLYLQIDYPIGTIWGSLKKGVDAYCDIMKDVSDPSVSLTSGAFQKKCSVFFGIRRNAVWQSKFYTIFDDYKSKGVKPSFKVVLNNLYLH